MLHRLLRVIRPARLIVIDDVGLKVRTISVKTINPVITFRWENLFMLTFLTLVLPRYGSHTNVCDSSTTRSTMYVEILLFLTRILLFY